MNEDGFWAAVVILVVGIGIGFALGLGVATGKAKHAAVAHGCASWIADENGKAVFTWCDE